MSNILNAKWSNATHKNHTLLSREKHPGPGSTHQTVWLSLVAFVVSGLLTGMFNTILEVVDDEEFY